jgi:hypothetical protein
MLNAIVVSIRFILLILGGQKQVALENAALRQQLAVFKRNVPRPKLNNRDQRRAGTHFDRHYISI